MIYNTKLLLCLMVFGLMISACNRPTDISEQNVSRVIQTLSADHMKGRHALKPEIHLSADFISNEFREIGLSTLSGLPDYKQNFTIYSAKPIETSVHINGQKLDSKYYFGLAMTPNLKWNTEDANIKNISSEDNYREKFRALTDDQESSVVLVSREHSKLFHRYRSYFVRSNRSLELNKTPHDVFILTDQSVRSFNIDLEYDITDHELSNIAGMIEGNKKDEIVLFSAHYDHIGVISPVDEDSVANGANDNASGVAGIIELARYFKSLAPPNRTIYFVAFTAEEIGGYGSTYFSDQIDPENIVALMNLEMIGKPAIEGPNTAWVTGFEYSSLGNILKESAADIDFEFYPDPYPNQNLFLRSDNAPFARLGIPAHSISTTPIDIDQDYHKVSDEFNTIHIPHTTNTIKAVANASKMIISGEKTPTRIDIEEIN
ncbi:M28 family metallopeptidase [Gracilimonas halophila]|uniref:M28 family metallopeptidase n=1 Tax=Gracilimonas halophila TaxID=1834464 RepID=A0ABW5JM57_9BACT